MWTYAAYRWPSEVAYLAALAAQGWQDGVPPDVALLVSGTLYGPSVDEETPGDALPGWHVAAAFRDCAAPEAWVGLEIDPAETSSKMPVLGISPVPPTVTNFQARVVLMQTPSGTPGVSMFAQIDAALRAGRDATSEGAQAWQAWEQANDFYRNGGLINGLGQQFGLTSGQIDTLFRRASTVAA